MDIRQKIASVAGGAALGWGIPMILPNGSGVALLLISFGVWALLWADITSETPLVPLSLRSSPWLRRMTIFGGAAIAFILSLLCVLVFGLGNSETDVLVNPSNTTTNVYNWYGNASDVVPNTTVPQLTFATESRNREASIKVTNNSLYPVSVRGNVTITESSDGRSFTNQNIQYGALWLGTVSETKTIPNRVSDNLSIVAYGNPIWNIPTFMTFLDSRCFNFMTAEHYLQNDRRFFSLGCHVTWGFGADHTTKTYDIVVTFVATSVANPLSSATFTNSYTVEYDPDIKGPILVANERQNP